MRQPLSDWQTLYRISLRNDLAKITIFCAKKSKKALFEKNSICIMSKGLEILPGGFSAFITRHGCQIIIELKKRRFVRGVRTHDLFCDCLKSYQLGQEGLSELPHGVFLTLSKKMKFSAQKRRKN